MEIFDFNVHLYSKEYGNLETQLKSNTELLAFDLIQQFELNFEKNIYKSINSANFMLFNQDIIEDAELPIFINKVKSAMSMSTFTLLFNFKEGNFKDRLEKAKEIGFKFIKFHSYTQQISEQYFDRICQICEMAEELKIGICIDTSFGTTGLYKYDNLKLAALIAEKIKKVPILLLHSGGSRVIDAMLIADLNPNVYLETSLSLHFYNGSNLIDDFAFVYKKIGYNRVLFASDYPYQIIDDAIIQFEKFCVKYKIPNANIERMFFKNAKYLIDGL